MTTSKGKKSPGPCYRERKSLERGDTCSTQARQGKGNVSRIGENNRKKGGRESKAVVRGKGKPSGNHRQETKVKKSSRKKRSHNILL